MFKNLKKQQEGFTIIEVMIVLVIAAVILLIVFLAVPALQRNSRNTQRKNDVAGLLNGVNEWSSNNGGKYPALTGSNAFLEQVAAYQNVKLGFYNASGAVLFSPTSGNVTNVQDTEHTIIVENATCNGANATAQSRSVAVLYAVETGGNSQPVCQSS